MRIVIQQGSSGEERPFEGHPLKGIIYGLLISVPAWSATGLVIFLLRG